jgi:hypothetical protein
MLGQAFTGVIVGSEDVFTHSFTFQNTHHGETVVEVALTSLNSIDDDDGTFARFSVTQIVSDSGVETFGDDGPAAILRTNVTSVSAEMFVDNSFAHGRVFRNFW